jgi:hypothetical protein
MRFLSIFVLACWGIFASPRAHAQNEVPLEYQVKAAYLVNFFKFLQWPDSENSSQKTICVLGPNKFGTALDVIVESAPDSERLKVARFESERKFKESAAECGILFVGAESRFLEASQAGAGVVVVGEENPAAHINLVLVDGKVKFRIQQERLEAVGVKVSSKLMKLALP